MQSIYHVPVPMIMRVQPCRHVWIKLDVELIADGMVILGSNLFLSLVTIKMKQRVESIYRTNREI